MVLFKNWIDEAGNIIGGNPTLSLQITENRAITAVYEMEVTPPPKPVTNYSIIALIGIAGLFYFLRKK